MRNGNKEVLVKFEKLSEAIMVWQSEHAVNKWKEKKQMAADKLVRMEELQRKNNILRERKCPGTNRFQR
jgi:hypothetical protein